MQHIYYDKEARAKIQAGINKAADAIKVTLGPVGKTMVIDLGQTYPTITDDGVTGAKVIKLEDPVEGVGAKLIREIAMKANDKAGDGTTTATVLAQAMIAEAFRIVDEDPSRIPEVQRGLQAALKEAKSQLDAMARPVDGKEDIRRVALISSLDEEVADAIAEVFETLGKTATVIVEEQPKPGISLETVKGMRIPKGLINNWFVSNPERNETRLDNPTVIVTDKRITSAEQLGALIQKLLTAKKLSFVIVAEDISGEALATLALNKQNGLYNCIPVIAPYADTRRTEAYEDIAALTGTYVISDRLGHSLNDVDVATLGSCKSAIANLNHTTLIEGSGDVTDQVKTIEGRLEDGVVYNVMYERETLQERLSGLTGGIGVLKVGAFSESERNAKRYKVEDALNATKAAIEEGIVPGGGAALMGIIGKTSNEIFDKTLVSPFRQMAENSGMDDKSKQSFHAVQMVEGQAFDFLSGKKVDAFDAGIIDPVKVTKSSLESAVSVVSTVLSVGSLIVEVPDKNADK